MMTTDQIPDELYGIPQKWYRKASRHLTAYFRANRDRYPDMVTFKEQAHLYWMARKGEKAANLRVSDAPNREEEG